MAIRKIGSRRITVDDVAYRWRIRRRATYGQECFRGTLQVAVELADHPSSVLLILTAAPHSRNCFAEKFIQLTPRDIVEWIRKAIQSGWNPSEPGPQFRLRVDSSSK
jgi:hypothetical protein